MNGITLDMNRDEFKEMLWETLNEKRSVSDEEHADHHKVFREILPFLKEFKEFMEERRHRKQLWNKFRLSMVGAIAVAIVGILTLPLTWIGSLIVDHITKLLRQ